MREVIRFIVRVAVTPIIAGAFGFFWLGFVLVIFPMFSFFSFLENERFSWREFIRECNDFFCRPLKGMWGRTRERT